MASIRKQSRGKSIEKAIDGAKRSMFTGMGFFIQVQPYAKALENSSVEMVSSAEQLGNTLLKYLELDEPLKRQPEPQAVKEDTLDARVAKIRKGAFDLAKLGLIIPFLLNKDSREYLASFISGLTGFSLEGIKTTLVAVTAVLSGMFALKLFKQINDTISAIQKLNEVTRTLFGITETASQDITNKSDELDTEKSKIEKDKEKRRNKRKAKVQRTRKLRSLLKGASTFAKLSLIGAAVGVIIDASISTVLDYNDQEDAVLDSEEEDGKAPEPESVWSLITKNIIESLTFGLINKAMINNTMKVFKGDEKAIAENKAAVSGMSVSGAEFGGFEGAGPEPAQPTGTITPQTTAPASSVEPASKPAGQVSIQSPSVQAVPSMEPINNTVSLVEKSEEIVSEKRAAPPPIFIINNIDNTTTVLEA